MSTLYEDLGVSPQATEAEIKKAYHSMAMKFHPDKNPGNAEAEAKCKEINEANRVLSDPVERSKYDRMLKRAPFSHGTPQGGHTTTTTTTTDGANFDEAFQSFFSGFHGAPTTTTPTRCTGGAKCRFLKTGKCWFSHTPKEIAVANKTTKQWLPPCPHGFNCEALKHATCELYHTKHQVDSARKERAKTEAHASAAKALSLVALAFEAFKAWLSKNVEQFRKLSDNSQRVVACMHAFVADTYVRTDIRDMVGSKFTDTKFTAPYIDHIFATYA
jgi:hypothetical protein